MADRKPEVALTVPLNNAVNTPRLTPAIGLGVLAVLVVLIGGFIGLSMQLGIQEFWAGFLFLLYWAGIQEMSFQKLPATVGGGFFGIFLVYLSQHIGELLGIADFGSVVFIGILLLVIYCQIMGIFSYLINNMTMLYLTVGTIPAIQGGSSLLGFGMALALSVVYFAGLVRVGKMLAALKLPHNK